MRAALSRDIVDDFKEIDVTRQWRRVAAPKLATPEIPTAGPTVSLMGAPRRLRVNWPRSSLSVRLLTVVTLLTSIVWSRASRPEPRLTAFRPPTVRELFSRDVSRDCSAPSVGYAC